MFHYHDFITDAGYNLGYLNSTKGCCYGMTLRWIESALLDEEYIFNTRMRRMRTQSFMGGDDPVSHVASVISQIAEKTRKKEALTLDETHLQDIQPFYSSVCLYQSPLRFFSFFNASYAQCDIDAVSRLAGSDKIIEQGGLSTVYSEPVIQTEAEVKVYLDELAKAIVNAGCNPLDKAAFLMASVSHAIGLIYKPAEGWQYMNISTYPSVPFGDDTAALAKKIMEGLKKPADSNFLAFNTFGIVTGKYEKRAQLEMELNKIKNYHEITAEIAARKERISLAFIAAKDAHPDIIKKLGEVGADLNLAMKTGETPAYIAAQNGHVGVIRELWKAGADLCKERNDGATPAFIAASCGHAGVIREMKDTSVDMNKTVDGKTPTFIAAQEGHANVIRELAKAGADLNKLSNGGSPAFIAAQKNHSDVIEALAEVGADLELPFISTADELRSFARKQNNPLIIERMNEVIEKKLETGEKEETISLTPREIASIMGHKNLLKQENIVSHNRMTG